MKFKNIIASFTCYFILTAFVGCVTCGVLFHSEIQQQKTLHFSDKKTGDINPAFLFEEDEDSDDTIELDVFHHDNYLGYSLNEYNFKRASVVVSETIVNGKKLKNPLFIHFRTLRI